MEKNEYSQKLETTEPHQYRKASIEGTLIPAHAAAAPEGRIPPTRTVLPRRDGNSTSVIVKSGSRKIVSIEAVTKTIHELTIPKLSKTAAHQQLIY